MKIAHIITGLNVGGAELMLKRLVLSEPFQRNNNKQIVISLTAIGQIGNDLIKCGCEVYALNINKRGGLIRGFFALRNILVNFKPDVIQTWMYHSDLFGGLAAIAAGCKNIFWGIRATEVNSLNTKFVRFLCAKLSFFVPNRIVCAAMASMKSHISYGYDQAKMLVINNGFDVDSLVSNSKFSDLERPFNISPEDFIIGSLGRYDFDKDHSNFVGACVSLFPDYKMLKVLIVGRNITDQNSELYKLILNSGYPERFFLHDETPYPQKFLAMMDVFCLHSRNEGFPNVLGEAMALSIPCVTTNVGDAPFLVGNAGLVVNKESPTELAIALKKLLDMPSYELNEIGVSLSERLKSNFTMRRTAELFYDLYTSSI